MERLELNCKPIVASCIWPPELLPTEEITRLRDAWRAAYEGKAKQELVQVEGGFLVRPDVIDETLNAAFANGSE